MVVCRGRGLRCRILFPSSLFPLQLSVAGAGGGAGAGPRPSLLSSRNSTISQFNPDPGWWLSSAAREEWEGNLEITSGPVDQQK